MLYYLEKLGASTKSRAGLMQWIILEDFAICNWSAMFVIHILFLSICFVELSRLLHSLSIAWSRALLEYISISRNVQPRLLYWVLFFTIVFPRNVSLWFWILFRKVWILFSMRFTPNFACYISSSWTLHDITMDYITHYNNVPGVYPWQAVSVRNSEYKWVGSQ